MAGSLSATGVSVSDPADAFEQAAEATARAVTSERQAKALAVPAADVQRQPPGARDEEEAAPHAQTLRASG